MFRDTIVDNDNYTVDLSYEHGEVFIHIDVYNFNPSIYESILDDWFDIEEGLYNEGFTRVFAIPKKLGLVKKMGWHHLCDVDFRGTNQGVYVWALSPYQF